MGRRHLTTTAVAAGIGTAFTLALVPFTSTAGAGHSTEQAPAHVISAAAVAGPAPSATPYVVGGAGFLLAGAGMVVVMRRTGVPAA